MYANLWHFAQKTNLTKVLTCPKTGFDTKKSGYAATLAGHIRCLISVGRHQEVTTW